MKVAIASDHAGYNLKTELVKYLTLKDIEIVDLGTGNSETSVDYPDYAKKVTDHVTGENGSLGILICATGIGMSIAANKVKGIRAAHVSDTFSAKMSRMHNNANVLCIGSKILDSELAREIVDVWLTSEYEGGRHAKRLDKIASIERGG